MSVAAAERDHLISGAGRFWYKTWPGKSGSWQGDASIPVLEGRPRNNNTLDGRRSDFLHHSAIARANCRVRFKFEGSLSQLQL